MGSDVADLIARHEQWIARLTSNIETLDRDLRRLRWVPLVTVVFGVLGYAVGRAPLAIGLVILPLAYAGVAAYIGGTRRWQYADERARAAAELARLRGGGAT